MAFFDDLKKGLSVTGQTVAQRTKEIGETVQLKTKLSTEKAELTKAYAAIGKQFFETAEDADAEKYEREFSVIRESLENIAQLEDQLKVLDGCICCMECGARIEKNSVFCSKCGAKVGKTAEPTSEGVSDDAFVDENEEAEQR